MDYQLIKDNILKISAIGADEKDGIRGTNRVFGTPAYQEGKEATLKYFEECGMKTYADSAGNVHGILSCGVQNAEEIWIGSHIDTVKEGGMLDGLLGVVSGAEVVRELVKTGAKLSKDIHIIGTNGEEGNDMGGTFGSRAMMGMLPLDNAEYIELGKTFGYTKEMLEDAVIDTSRAACWLELHIEQGPTLDINKEQIGVVTGIVGLRRYKITVHGQSNHAGTTMMKDRNDALVSAARLILMGDELAREIGHNFVETVGILKVFPSSVAVIPGSVEFIVEIRNEDTALMDHFLEEYKKRAAELADISISPVVDKAPIHCDEKLVALTDAICKEKGLKYRQMPSGATHDGNAMAMKMPVGMIFVPSIKGISHARYEKTEWEDIYTGVDVLYDLVTKLAAGQ